MDKQELVNLCKAGDKHAISILYKTYAKSLKNICLSYTHNSYVADDILHDGFIIIITSINQLKDPEKLESWMNVIMRNLSIKYINTEKCTVPLTDVKEDDEPTDDSALVYSDYKTILDLIERLPKGYRTVFKHAVLDGMSHKEIGQELCINEKSSSSQLARAKKILRDLLMKEGLKSIIIVLLFIPERLGRVVLFNHQSFTVPSMISTLWNYRAGKNSVFSSSTKLLKEERKDSTPTDTFRNESVAYEPESPVHKERKDVDDPGDDFQYNAPKHFANNILPVAKHLGQWSISVSYYPGTRFDNTRIMTVPGSIVSGGDEEYVKEKINYHIPFVISLSLQKQLSKKWSIVTGLQYTRMETDIIRSDSRKVTTQIGHYIGIPLQVRNHFFNNSKLSYYTSYGVTLHLPVDNKFSVQAAISSGAGLLYKITPHAGLFIEPAINYYFKGNNTPIMWKEHPLEITIPIGVSYSW